MTSPHEFFKNHIAFRTNKCQINLTIKIIHTNTKPLTPLTNTINNNGSHKKPLIVSLRRHKLHRRSPGSDLQRHKQLQLYGVGRRRARWRRTAEP